MKKTQTTLPVVGNDIDKFLKKSRDIKSMTTYGRKVGRLAFIIDATASRQPTWDQAREIQAQMFKAVEEVGRLEIQLIYFRGHADFSVSEWYSDSKSLSRAMREITCDAGQTRIQQALDEVLDQTIQKKISCAVFIGDACEEATRGIYRTAGELGVRKTPVFMFQEYHDAVVEEVFRAVAKLSGGAYCRFDSKSAGLLAELLSAVAVYAAGGEIALKTFARSGQPQISDIARQLLK